MCRREEGFRGIEPREPHQRGPDRVLVLAGHQWISRTEHDAYERSPRMRRASWMSLGKMVTRLAWMAQRLVSSKRPTR